MKGRHKVLKPYLVYFWNQQNQKVGMTIHAQSALDAKFYAERLPEFKTLIQYPQAL